MNTLLVSSPTEPTDAEIQHAAYLLWIEEGRPDGRDVDHWLAAKELLKHRASLPPKVSAPPDRPAPRRTGRVLLAR